MDDAEKKASRMAELAYEILGAQSGAKLIQELWDAATPGLKTKIADEFLIKTAGSMSNWSIEKVIAGEIERRVSLVLDGELAPFTADVLKQFAERKDAAVAITITNLVNRVTAKLTSELADHLKSWSYRGS